METFTSNVAGVQTIITGDEETFTSDVACVQTIITGDDGDTHQCRGRCSDYNNR